VQKPEPEKNYSALREQVEAAYDQIADRYARKIDKTPLALLAAARVHTVYEQERLSG